MRIVCMVPSWTETLLKAGVQVVGRTRYCIHPEKQITSVPIVGGTKDVDWELVKDLKPDLVLMDQEENPLEMAEECPLPYLATHVHSLRSLHTEMVRLAEHFENATLMEWAVDLYDILEAAPARWDFNDIPAVMEWVRKPSKSYDSVIYLIWRKPWMAVSRETYIGSVLEALGARVVEFPEGEKYPVIELEDHRQAFFLFSSEPFPFHKKLNELKVLGVEGAVVDGESFSWFGIRSLEFLKERLLRPPLKPS